MARGRTLLLVGLVLLALSVLAVVAIMNLANGGNSQPPSGDAPTAVAGNPDGSTGQVEPVSSGSLDIVVAVQDLQRGVVIPTEALGTIAWPTEMVPTNAITDAAQIVGSRARYTIQRNEPIFTTMIVKSLQDLSPFGSDTAGRIPRGFTAISLPYDLDNGVANGVRSGDYVNILVSMAFVDIDRDFQTLLPNLSAGVLGPGTQSQDAVGALPPQMIVAGIVPAGDNAQIGRAETDPVLGETLYIVPSEQQRSRLVSQSIIQNVLVMGMGVFGPDAPTVPAAAPEGTAVPAGVVDPNATPTVAPTATPTPPPPQLITVAVSPQEALVLDYVNRLAERFPDAVQYTYTLRSAGDTSLAETQSVTLQYMVDTYKISLPSKLNYGLDTTDIVEPTPAPTTP
ncbi:MAG TPA: SAF domain-containing protein [Anaerolineales bacterium]|nr:SAF domain-containing protein [Anaerolineales bacterium]